MPIAAPSSAVMMLSWRIIRRTCRRVMPTARSMPSSRVRSNVESTSVLTIPNSDTITASASSTMKMASSESMSAVMSAMNPSLLTRCVSGKAASAFSTAAGSLVVTNASRSRLVSKARSNACFDTVIGPSESESRTGDSSIPRTVQRELDALHRGDRERVADLEAVLGGPAVVDHRAVRPERGEDAVGAVLPLEVEDLADRGAVDAVDDLLATGHEAAVLAQRADRGHAGHAGRGARDLRVHRRPAVLRRDHVRRGDAVVERALGLLTEAVGHDGDRGHQHHADHQRAGGDRRAAGVAHRVAARQPAGGAADGGRRPAEQRRRRPHEAGRQRSLRAAGSASRSAATGAIFVARRAGRNPAASVTSVPTSSATIAVRASNTVPACGQLEVHRAEHGVEPRGEAEARARCR